MHCEPAASIIRLLGGLTALASAAQTTPTTVQRWRLPNEKGGTGGFIPRRHHALILKHARKVGVGLTPAAFLDVKAVPRASRSRAAGLKHG